MSPFQTSTFERRRQLEIMADQLMIMRGQKEQLDAQTRSMDSTSYTQERYYAYKNLLARRTVMAAEISRVEEAYAERKDALEASLLADYKKRFADERKAERNEAKPEGVKKRLSRLFRHEK